MKNQIRMFALSALAMAWAAGCASAPPPEAKLASSAAAIRAAQELHGGADSPAPPPVREG